MKNNFIRLTVLSTALLGLCFGLTACGSSVKTKKIQPTIVNSSNWQSDGQLALFKPLPSVTIGSLDSGSLNTLYAFMPVNGAHYGTWLAINIQNGTINLMEGEKALSTITGVGVSHLKPGIYQVLHKQRNALWYAPDKYFTERGLALPSSGDRSRFRRGALGDFVLFIAKDTPIHSGPIWTSEVGGIQLNEQDISSIYYRLDVGASVEVK